MSASRTSVATAVSATTPRRPTGGASARFRALPTSTSSSVCPSPRKPSARSTARAVASHGSPALKPPATMRTSLAKSGEGGRPASVPSEMPSDAPRAGLVRAMPEAARLAGGGCVREQRRRCVEAERLGDRVPDDVDDHACDRERSREREAEREHAHVLEARVREQALPRLRAPEERDGDRERQEPEADEERARRVLADGGGERTLGAPRDDEHGGKQRGREQRGHGRRRLGVSVRKPVVHGRPADLGGEAGEQEHERRRQLVGALVDRAERAPRQAPEPALDARRDEDDAEERDAEPERREHEVLPAGLERRRASAEADEQDRGGGRRLDQEPRDAEIPRERHRDEDRPEGEQGAVVEARAALGSDELGRRTSGGRPVTSARSRDRRCRRRRR